MNSDKENNISDETTNLIQFIWDESVATEERINIQE